MVPFSARVLGVWAVLLLAGAIAYGGVQDDGSATAVLAFAFAGAVALGVLLLITDSDTLSSIGGGAAEGAPAMDVPSAGRVRRGLPPTPWPVVGALGVGGAAVAAASGVGAVTPVAFVAAVGGVGWLFRTWAEHPSYTPRFGARLRERLLIPVGLPLAVLTLVGVIAVSLSRLLLALPEQGSRATALSFALLVLISAFTVAASERVTRTALVLLCVITLMVLGAAGIVAAVSGHRHFERKPGVTAPATPSRASPTPSPATTP